MAPLSRRRPPHVVCHALELRREREHLDPHRGARHRDRHLQRGPCVGAHRAAAVDQQHESRRPPWAAQPTRRQRLAAGLEAGAQRASKVEASSPARRPPAARQAQMQPANERSRGIAPGALDARQLGRVGRVGVERAVARWREDRRLFEPLAADSSGAIGPPPGPDASSASAADGEAWRACWTSVSRPSASVPGSRRVEGI